MPSASKMLRLLQQAKRVARFRKHDVRKAKHESPTLASLKCLRCGLEAVVNTKPMPNEIEIGGELVALNCYT